MSSLRGRTRDSSWQWLVIGIVLGLGCSSVTCLGSYALGYLKFNLPGSVVAEAATPTLGATPTPVTIIITTTPPPTATNAPTNAPATIAAAQSGGTEAPTSFVQLPTIAGTAQAAPSTAPVGTKLAVPATAAPTRVPNSKATAAAEGITLPAPQTQIPAELAPTDMVTITGGIFKMGTTTKEATQAVDECTSRDKAKCVLDDTSDSIPEHDVTIDSFQLEKYEVSYDQYIAFLNSLSESYKTACDGEACVALQDNNLYKGSYIKQEGPTYKLTSELYHDHPIAFVTWYGAAAYCKAIGRRLPTEAEWERAARSTDKRIYPWGNDWDSTKANTSKPSQGGTIPVDKDGTGASVEGVLNLAGNVSEWVSDFYDPSYYKTSDTSRFFHPRGPAKGQERVIRGGSWDNPPFFARAVQRQSHAPNDATGFIGFRCAADAPAGGKTGSTSSGGTPPAANTPGGAKPTLHP